MKTIDHLCLVDDDDVFRFLTRKVIEETKLVNRIEIFSNGLSAIQFLKANLTSPEGLPEIILLDLTMPVMDGWGFLEEFIKIKPHTGKKITIYIVSSSIDPADIKKARSISVVSDFIIKPVTRIKLMHMLEELNG